MADATLLDPTREDATAAPPDEELVARAQADPACFSALYARYRGPVFAYCRYRLPGWEEAEDAAAEVFLAAYRALPGYRPRGKGFRAWLFVIARNEVGQRARRVRPALPFADLLDAPDPAPSPEERAVDADAWACTLALLAELPEGERRVCELRLAGLTFAEIAAVLGKRDAAVRKAESRAVDRLRRMLPLLGGGEGGRRGA